MPREQDGEDPGRENQTKVVGPEVLHLVLQDEPQGVVFQLLAPTWKHDLGPEKAHHGRPEIVGEED
jgi:hypothetical protein